MSKQILYFPNLNGLRFIAAFLVVIHHLEQNKSIFNLPNYWDVPGIYLMGKLGVVLFFVLSGYLITYLLLQEKKETTTINVRKFYTRRILRIWPLYYLIVLTGLFILPHIDFISMQAWRYEVYRHFDVKIAMFIFFLPNLALAVFPRVPYIAQSWSIGVEEQFYFIWPFLVKKFNNVRNMLLGVIIFYFGIKLSLIVLHRYLPNNEMLTKIYGFWRYYFTIDCMAFGGLGAYVMFFNKQNLLKIFFNKYFQIFLYIATISLISIGIRFPNITNEVYSILFSVIILNLAGNKKSIVNIEFKWLAYLGKISYGVYMYHILMATIAIKSLLYLHLYNNLNVLLLTLALTIMISVLSYEFFEKRFIKAKLKYSTVVSGDNAIDIEKSNLKSAVINNAAIEKVPATIKVGVMEPELKD